MPFDITHVKSAIFSVQSEIRWKAGKDIVHLATRKDWQHLAADATLADYHSIISSVVHNVDAQVYLYHFGNNIYPSIVAEIEQQLWLVMFGLNGILETAFVVEEPEGYLGKVEFELIGSLREVLR